MCHQGRAPSVFLIGAPVRFSCFRLFYVPTKDGLRESEFVKMEDTLDYKKRTIGI